MKKSVAMARQAQAAQAMADRVAALEKQVSLLIELTDPTGNKRAKLAKAKEPDAEKAKEPDAE